MAKKKIVDEELRYTIIVNGDTAQKELFDLERAQRSLRESNKALQSEKARLEAANKKSSKAYAEVRRQIAANNKEIKTNEERMSALRKQIGITGLTLHQLTKEAKSVEQAMRHMTKGSADYNQMALRLSQVNARIVEMKRDGRQAAGVIETMNQKFHSFRYIGLTIIGVLTGWVVGLQKLTDFSGKLADAQSDVQKTTGLTDKEIQQLTKDLGLFQTRTARIELLKLGAEAGKLGKKSSRDILEFVRTGDKIKVALGDDLQGDVEENIRLIGKLTEQYQVGSKWGASFGQGMEMIGSGINEVSASGSAQAGYLVDYLNRLVGVSRQAGISAEANLGYAATLDEAGQSVEVSATAMNQVIVGMFKDTETYAKIAGVGVGDFRDLLNKDANEALLLFLQGLNGNNDGLEMMSKRMDGLGLDGTRVVAVLAALSSQTEKIREKQDLANRAMEQGTSLTDEFNKKNTNFAAVLDKIRKAAIDWFVDGAFVKGVENAVVWFGKFIGVVEDSDGSVTAFREKLVTVGKVLMVVAAAAISYKTALVLVEMWSKRAATAEYLHGVATRTNAAATAVARAATLLYAAAKALLTGNITRATAAMKLFRAVLVTTPLGAVAAIVGAAAAAWMIYADSVDGAATVQRTLNSVHAEAEKSIAKERAELDRLLAIAKNEKLSKEEREKTILRLNQISPEYLGNLTLEKIGTMEATAAVDNYIESLNRKALAVALQSKREELYTQLIENQNKPLEESITWWNRLTSVIASGGNTALMAGRNLSAAAENRAKENAAIREQIAALNDLEKSLMESGQISTDPAAPPDTTAGGGSPTEEELKKLDTLRQRIKAIARELEISRLQENEREIEQIKDKYAELIRQAEGHGEEIKLLEGLRDAEINLKRLEQEKEFQQKLLETRKAYGLMSSDELKQQDLTKLKEAYDAKLLTDEEYQRAKQAIELRYEQDAANARYQARKDAGLTTDEDDQAQEIAKLEESLNNQLITQEEYEAAKAAIIKKYQDQRQLEEDEAHKKRIQRIIDEIGIYASFLDAAGATFDALKAAELAQVEEVTRRKGETEEEFTARKEQEEKKRKDIAKKYAKTEMLIKVGNIIASTAAAIMKGFETLGPFGWPFAIAMGITGAAQAKAATAEANKVQGYEDGLYPVMDQKGRKFNARPVMNAGTDFIRDPSILVGEKPEIIIDPRTTRFLQVNAPEVIESIFSAARRVRGFESGNYPRQVEAPTSPSISPAQESTSWQNLLVDAIRGLIRILDRGIKARAVYDDQEARNLKKLMEEMEEVESEVKQN